MQNDISCRLTQVPVRAALHGVLSRACHASEPPLGMAWHDSPLMPTMDLRFQTVPGLAARCILASSTPHWSADWELHGRMKGATGTKTGHFTLNATLRRGSPHCAETVWPQWRGNAVANSLGWVRWTGSGRVNIEHGHRRLPVCPAGHSRASEGPWRPWAQRCAQLPRTVYPTAGWEVVLAPGLRRRLVPEPTAKWPALGRY